MHQSAMIRMKWFVDNYIPKDKKVKVLDIGSYSVNGNYKEFFKGKTIFCNCDDDRAEKLINVIYNLSKKYQVFVCTCRSRELDFLKNKSDINIIDIQKGW